jgi:hypothetical protein
MLLDIVIRPISLADPNSVETACEGGRSSLARSRGRQNACVKPAQPKNARGATYTHPSAMPNMATKAQLPDLAGGGEVVVPLFNPTQSSVGGGFPWSAKLAASGPSFTFPMSPALKPSDCDTVLLNGALSAQHVVPSRQRRRGASGVRPRRGLLRDET